MCPIFDGSVLTDFEKYEKNYLAPINMDLKDYSILGAYLQIVLLWIAITLGLSMAYAISVWWHQNLNLDQFNIPVQVKNFLKVDVSDSFLVLLENARFAGIF